MKRHPVALLTEPFASAPVPEATRQALDTLRALLDLSRAVAQLDSPHNLRDLLVVSVAPDIDDEIDPAWVRTQLNATRKRRRGAELTSAEGWHLFPIGAPDAVAGVLALEPADGATDWAGDAAAYATVVTSEISDAVDKQPPFLASEEVLRALFELAPDGYYLLPP